MSTPAVMLMWSVSQDDNEKTYYMGFELRDYKNNYINYTPVSKDFIVNMIAKMEILERDEYTYNKKIMGTYQQEGLR